MLGFLFPFLPVLGIAFGYQETYWAFLVQVNILEAMLGLHSVSVWVARIAQVTGIIPKN